MESNIKNFILEGEKEFEEEWNKSQSWGGGKFGSFEEVNEDQAEFMASETGLLDWYKSKQISLIKMIVEMVESEKKDGSDETRNRIEKVGYGYLYERLIGHNIALDTISSKLKELIDGK